METFTLSEKNTKVYYSFALFPLLYEQESHRGYGTAVRKIVIHLNALELNRSEILAIH